MNALVPEYGERAWGAINLAVALATYITKQSFVEVSFSNSGNHTIDNSLVADVQSYGLEVTVGNVGSTSVNVGDNGGAFGVADGSDVAIIDLLLAVNSRSNDGLLFDANGDGVIDETEKIDRIMANDVFDLINEFKRWPNPARAATRRSNREGARLRPASPIQPDLRILLSRSRRPWLPSSRSINPGTLHGNDYLPAMGITMTDAY